MATRKFQLHEEQVKELKRYERQSRRPDHRQRRPVFTYDDFQYDAQQDRYQCLVG